MQTSFYQHYKNSKSTSTQNNKGRQQISDCWLIMQFSSNENIPLLTVTKAIPRIKEQNAFNVCICFVDSGHKADTVAVRWNRGNVSLHHILHIAPNVVNLQACTKANQMH